MGELFEFFPELELLLIAVALLGATHLVRRGWAWKLDASRIPKPAQAEAQLGPYREAMPDEQPQPLAVGRLPRPEQVWTVAWLGGGKQGVVQALMAHAGAAGWLIPTKANFRVIETGPTSTDPVLVSFWKELAPAAGLQLSAFEVHALAVSAAQRHEAELCGHAKTAGLIRSAADERKLGLIQLLGGLLTELALLWRVCTMTDLRHDVFAGSLFGAVVAFSVMLADRPSPSTAAKRYLDWLEASVESSLTAVNAGQRRQPAEVTLAVALAGISAMGMSPVLADMARAYQIATESRDIV
jgi:hypothetical protein